MPASLYNGSLLPFVKPQFLDEEGTPIAGGLLYFYTAGSTTPQDTFNDSALTPGSENSNPIELDAGGYTPDPVYLSAIGYKVSLHDADDVLIWERDDVEDLGQVFANTFGVLLGTPTTYVNGEVIPATERYARINSSSGSTTVYVVAAADMTQPLTIKNMGGNAVTVTADGVDTFESGLTTLTIPAAATPVFPAILLASDGISNISILSSHGMS